MTQLDALRELLGKVEAGTLHKDEWGGMPSFSQFHFKHPIGGWSDNKAMNAYHGSMDAALSLFDAVLPGWEWRRCDDGEFMLHDENTNDWSSGNNNNPARALLIAIIKAKISELEAA